MVKTFHGQRVLATRRKGDRILVKLASRKRGGRPHWVSATARQYGFGKGCVRQKGGGGLSKIDG